ncbi:MAG: glycosyltransferase [Rhodoferax sp.]|nr:glycosyltransferase [Rhodoferax sp.]
MNQIRAFLQKAYYTLSGWRFHDLKEFIRLHHGQQTSYNSADFVLSLDTALACREKSHVKNAIISSMPPADTGVATCNFKTLFEAEAEVDIFSTWDSIEAFASFEANIKEGMSAFNYASMPLFAARRKYRNLVVSVGNSDHNFFAVMALTRFPYRTVCDNVSLHVHDGCLLNLADKLMSLQGKTLMDGVLATYKEADHDELSAFAASCTERWRLIEGLVNRGIYGLRIVIEMTRPTRVLANSAFAAEMVQKDYGPQGCPLPVAIAFHPIFLSDVRCTPYQRWHKDIELRVGTFGIPSESKGTYRIIEACRELVKFGIRVRLVMAGFAVNTYLERTTNPIDDIAMEIHSDVLDDDLLDVMDGVHIAVQLRKRNLGESSGVIASLIKKNVPTIVTATGSFKEYQYSCVLVEEDVSASELAVSMLTLAQGNDYDSMHQSQVQYAESHSSLKLCETLFL